jgi:sigma-B regulation protein RsbU (phosphoserine phosphatase)
MALIVGDVSGKGVGAALLMANIQATLRARLPLELDLPTLVDTVDRDVAASTPGEVYLTLFIAILDPVRGVMRYVNAGHNPQYVVRADGSLESMPATGLPVGMLPGHGYEQRTARVHPGDLIFLYTDGATEAEDETGDMFGHERLQAALAAAPKGDAASVLVSIETVVRAFRGTVEPLDDATMMAVRVGSIDDGRGAGL